jgi:hypothetical protein
MEANGTHRIGGCAELSVGERVEAWRHGRVTHRGRVSGTVPSMQCVWIIDARTGTRILLDVTGGCDHTQFFPASRRGTGGAWHSGLTRSAQCQKKAPHQGRGSR